MADEATLKFEDLKTKSEEQLKDILLDLKKEQLNLRFQKAAGNVEDVSRFNKVRKQIARIKTILSDKN